MNYTSKPPHKWLVDMNSQMMLQQSFGPLISLGVTPPDHRPLKAAPLSPAESYLCPDKLWDGLGLQGGFWGGTWAQVVGSGWGYHLISLLQFGLRGISAQIGSGMVWGSFREASGFGSGAGNTPGLSAAFGPGGSGGGTASQCARIGLSEDQHLHGAADGRGGGMGHHSGALAPGGFAVGATRSGTSGASASAAFQGGPGQALGLFWKADFRLMPKEVRWRA